MYCIDTEALVFMFNGGSSYGFTINPIFTRIFRDNRIYSQGDNRIYSQGARAASVVSTQSYFTSFEKQYQVFNGLDGHKGPLLVYTNII